MAQAVQRSASAAEASSKSMRNPLFLWNAPAR
jgi:hypothetical protein